MSYVLVPSMVASAPSTGIGFNASVSQTGLFLLPMGLAGMVAAPLVSHIERLTSIRCVMTLSGLTLAAGVWILAQVPTQQWEVFAASTLVGTAVGLGLTVVIKAVIETIPASRAAQRALTGLRDPQCGGARRATGSKPVKQRH